MKRVYGWKRQIPDHRDFKLTLDVNVSLPESIDLEPFCPPVYDQMTVGSCTANGIAALIQFDLIKQKLQNFIPSRLFIYYNERAIEGTVKSDSGANIRDGIKSINNQGVCPETEWPYIISKFKTKPSKKCYTDALQNVVQVYKSVNQDLNSIKSVLASGYPVVFGMSVYESFESPDVAKTGIIPMPTKTESCLGGHCMAIVGYDNSKNAFKVRNSWNTTWGLQGYCWIPYNYLTNQNLSSDFWVINLIK